MSGEIDHTAARELYLFIDNDGDLYRQQYQPILKNLITKQARGIYDKDKAIKLWMYLVESGAKKYVREFGGGEWHRSFDVPTRREVAHLLNEHFLEESALGALASLLPKKYQKKEVRHAIKAVAGGKKRRGRVALVEASFQHHRRMDRATAPGGKKPAALGVVIRQHRTGVWYVEGDNAFVSSDTYRREFFSSVFDTPSEAKRAVKKAFPGQRFSFDVRPRIDLDIRYGGKKRHATSPSSKLGALVASINRLTR